MNIRTILYLAASVFAINLGLSGSGYAAPPGHEGKYKVLHVMSFHSPWQWTDGQLQGFQEAMQGVPTEYKVFQLDAKRNSSTEAKEKKGKEARDLIDAWKPDLVYTSDDEAQEYVAKYYVNKDTPFVFSGVNADPKLYGFTGSRNNTGVLEQEHFVESVKLLKAIAPDVKRIAVVFDDASMWDPVMKRMKEQARELPGVQFVVWDVIRTFEEFKQKIRGYPGQADAIAMIGIFNFKDENGKNVPFEEVLKWTTENSRLPDFSFWGNRVDYGTLCSVTVSEREQGLAAGRMARAILVEGKSPASFAMKPTVKGIPMLSLARAAKLGIKVKSGILLSAVVVQKFEWDK